MRFRVSSWNAVFGRSPFQFCSAQLLEELPFPERALIVKIKSSIEMRMGSFHTPPGANRGKIKPQTRRAITEWLAKQSGHIILGIDANCRVLCQVKAYDQSPIDLKGFPLHHSTGSESGEGRSPARFFASSGPAIQKSRERGKKGRTMNRSIQLKKAKPQANRLQPGGMKTLLAALALVLMGSGAWAAHVGDSVFAFVPVENRVQLAVSTDPQEVTHIVLDSGVWEISGQINFLSLNTPVGTMFTAGNISVNTLSFNPPETAAVQAEQVAFLGNIIRPVALVPRTIEVDDGTTVFLVAGSFNPNPNVTAWGFITAVKIRNHVL
jgi:hypothetical protein